MRLVLILAVLAGLLPSHPAMSHGGAHCVAPGQPAAEAHPAHAHEVPASDCPHCPPARCALQPHCGQVGTAHLAWATPDAPIAGPAASAGHELVLAWPSRTHSPPVPPPVARLT